MIRVEFLVGIEIALSNVYITYIYMYLRIPDIRILLHVHSFRVASRVRGPEYEIRRGHGYIR